MGQRAHRGSLKLLKDAVRALSGGWTEQEKISNSPWTSRRSNQCRLRYTARLRENDGRLPPSWPSWHDAGRAPACGVEVFVCAMQNPDGFGA